jgi:hypothetical protein
MQLAMPARISAPDSHFVAEWRIRTGTPVSPSDFDVLPVGLLAMLARIFRTRGAFELQMTSPQQWTLAALTRIDAPDSRLAMQAMLSQERVMERHLPDGPQPGVPHELAQFPKVVFETSRAEREGFWPFLPVIGRNRRPHPMPILSRLPGFLPFLPFLPAPFPGSMYLAVSPISARCGSQARSACAGTSTMRVPSRMEGSSSCQPLPYGSVW